MQLLRGKRAYPHERLTLPPIELSSILLSRLAVSMHKDGYGAELPRTCCDRSIARRGLPGLECVLQVEQCSGAPNAKKGPSSFGTVGNGVPRSEEHTTELQSLMRISYAVFCMQNKKTSHN